MKNLPEEKAKKFYSTKGWEKNKAGQTLDSQKWEDLRECSQLYVRSCRERLGKHIPNSGNIMMDLGSGPIQYDEYLSYSENFRERHCIDLAENALQEAKKRAKNVRTFCGNFLEIDFEGNFYDCIIAQHVLYHMHKDDQLRAVKKMVDLCNKEGKIIIVYGNPNSPFAILLRIYDFIRNLTSKSKDSELYVFTFPLSWWYQFEGECKVEIYPWRTFSYIWLQKLVPDNEFGKKFLKFLFHFEENFPRFLTNRIAQYPAVVLTKQIN